MNTDKHRLGKATELWWGAVVLFLLPAGTAAQETRAVVDETGRRVEVPARVERIVSLAPSLTEIVFALGLEEKLVGVTSHCDFPPAARAKPQVGDVLNPSLEKILTLHPDLVLGSTAGNRRETVEALERLGVPLYGVNPRSVPEVFASIRHVAALTGAEPAAAALVTRLEEQLAGVEARSAGAPRPRVLFVVWLEPLVTVGHDTFLNDILERAGAESVTRELEESWPRISLEEVIARDPDYLVLPRTAGLEGSLARLAQQEPWRRLRAVRENHILWMEDAILRPGPRVVEAVAALSAALHPEPAREARTKP